MAEYVYVGRRRNPVWLVVWQFLTLGVYGRVWLYKLLREFDGHEALFMDRRPYLLLLILPFVGPFLVKRRITVLLGDLVHHDVTASHHRPGRLTAAALVPLLPLFHVLVQRSLNHHWKMHTKETELQLKREEVESLRHRARSPDQVRQVKSLEAEAQRRARELEDLRNAALALREAERVRRRAEAEMRRSGGRAGPLGMVRKILPSSALRASLSTLRRLRPKAGKIRGAPEAAQEPEPESPREVEEAPAAPVEAPGPVEPPARPRGWYGLGGRTKEPVPVEASMGPTEPKEPRRGRKAGALAEAAQEPRERRPLFGFLKGLRGTPQEREERQKAKEEARNEKRRVKEQKRAARLAEREARNKDKKRGEQEKRRRKESRRRAKERKRQRKLEQRARKKEEKLRRQELRKMEKDRRRQEKQQEKERRKQEKERSKQEKQRAKEAKRKEKEAAKAASKKPRKGGRRPGKGRKTRAKR